jgi:hypothetical protein
MSGGNIFCAGLALAVGIALKNYFAGMSNKNFINGLYFIKFNFLSLFEC